jgi:chemotaxis protein MotA
MDPGTIIGLVLAFGGILLSMLLEGSSPMAIILIPPMVLVFFGTFGAAMAGGLMKDGIGVVASILRAITTKAPDPQAVIETILPLADKARREGLLALEDAARDIDDDFLKRGLGLAIDGTDPEDLRSLLESEVDVKRAVDRAGAKIFADMAGYAPTIGIIGTVIGLVHVLSNLAQPATLGKLIASAFIATLWGVMTANVFWMPLSNKLKRLSELEAQQMNLVIEGIMSIQSGANPRLVAQRLRALAPPTGAGEDDAKAA